MVESYEKKDENTLVVTNVENITKITEETREEIQTQLERLEFSKSEIQKQIDRVKTKIAILEP